MLLQRNLTLTVPSGEIGFTNNNNSHCGMNLSLQADFWNILNSEEMLTACWNGLDRK